MLQGVPKKGDSCLMTSKDLNILDTDKYSERKIEAIEKTTRVNMKVLQSRNKRRTLEKRMHST